MHDFQGMIPALCRGHALKFFSVNFCRHTNPLDTRSLDANRKSQISLLVQFKKAFRNVGFLLSQTFTESSG